MRFLPCSVALALVALLAGCLTTPAQRVETLGAGNVEVALEGGASVLNETQATPAANVALRVGVSERVDLGFRLGTWAYEVQSKWLLTREGASTPVSLAPSFMVLSGADPFDNSAGEADQVGLGFLRVPVLVGVPVGEHQLVLGPGVNLIGGVGEGAPSLAVEPRLSIGFSAQLAPGVRLHPEVAAGFGAFTTTEGYQGGYRASGVVALAFGTAR